MTFQDTVRDTVVNGLCTVLEVQDNYYDWVSNSPIITTDIAHTPIDMAYRYLCNREPPAPLAPAFTGGQCFVNYYVVSNAVCTRISDGSPGLSGEYTRSNVPGQITGFNVTSGFSGPFAVHQLNIVSQTTTGQVLTNLLEARKDIYNVPSATFAAIARMDGLPDNCGNPPAPDPDPEDNYTTVDVDFTYVDNSDTDIDLSGSFTFASPIVNISGELVIPVSLNIGTLTIPVGGTINVNNNTLNIDLRHVAYKPTSDPTPDSYKSPDDTPDCPPSVPTPVLPPSPDNPDYEPTGVIRAVIVTVTVLPDNQGVIDQDDNPDIFIPNLGYVNFLIATGLTVSWTVDLAVKNERCFIPCPWDGGAIAVRGTPRPGVSWTLTPVFTLSSAVPS